MIMKMNQLNFLNHRVIEWAKDRGILEGATPAAQMVKLTEEIGELAGGIARNKEEVIADSIGDAFVVLSILAEMYNLDFQKCCDMAVETIEGRTGKMIDGVWVKSEDLNNET